MVDAAVAREAVGRAVVAAVWAALGAAGCSNLDGADLLGWSAPECQASGAPAPAGGLPSAVVVAVDVSETTKAPSGIDADGDGVVGEDTQGWYLPRQAQTPTWSTDPGDSVLEAELAGASALFAEPALAEVPIGLVAYASRVHPGTGFRLGDGSRDAWLVVAPTVDRDALAHGLAKLRRRGSRGVTNLAAAIALSVRTADESEHAGAALLVLAASYPTLPHGNGWTIDREDLDAAKDAALSARVRGSLLHLALFGDDAPERGFAWELARCAGGRTVLVRRGEKHPSGALRGLLVPEP
jgi:hypothetical protein